MRKAAVTAFADHFEAALFHSGYFEGNDASSRVPERVGHSPNGVKSIVAQDGLVHTAHQGILSASGIVKGPDPVEVAVAEVGSPFPGTRLALRLHPIACEATPIDGGEPLPAMAVLCR